MCEKWFPPCRYLTRSSLSLIPFYSIDENSIRVPCVPDGSVLNHWKSAICSLVPDLVRAAHAHENIDTYIESQRHISRTVPIIKRYFQGFPSTCACNPSEDRRPSANRSVQIYGEDTGVIEWRLVQSVEGHLVLNVCTMHLLVLSFLNVQNLTEILKLLGKLV